MWGKVMKKDETIVENDEQLDPDIEKALTILGLSAREADISSTVTDSVSVDEPDTPNPYEEEEAPDSPKLMRRQEPKPKEIFIGGKRWWDITEILGNSEEIIALHTVPDPKKKKKGKVPKVNADGVLIRPDR